MTKPRYVARYMCSLDDAEAVRTWFIIDTLRGVPLADDAGIRLFTKADAQAEMGRLESQNEL